MRIETANYNDAFCHEFLPGNSPELIKIHLISYLGEYRLRIPRYSYALYLKNGILTDLDGKSLVVQGENAIKRRLLQGKSADREGAEYFGLQQLENGLKEVVLGDVIVWCSPPGPKEDGYGDYGFVYLGQVTNQDRFGSKELLMNALRVEKPTLTQFNNFLADLCVETTFNRGIDFLMHPMILSPESPSISIDDFINLFKRHFNFELDEGRTQFFRQIIRKLNPYINMYIEAIKNYNFSLAKEILNTMENLAVKLRDSRDNGLLEVLPYMPTFQVIESFKFTPPLIAGSCGLTSVNSSNIFSKIDILSSEERYPDYQCPHCHKTIQGELKNNEKGWKTKCPHCDSPLNCRS